MDLNLFRQVFKGSLFIFIFNLILYAPRIYAANSDLLAGKVVDFIHLFCVILELEYISNNFFSFSFRQTWIAAKCILRKRFWKNLKTFLSLVLFRSV